MYLISKVEFYKIEEAFEWSKRAIDLSNKTSVKGYILHGCTILVKAQTQKQHNIKLKLYDSALESFKT